MERTDTELVAAACQGDVASFRQLYERHYRLAVGIARSRLADVHLAEDAAQEAFAVASKRLALLRDGQRFPQWLGTICRRIASKLAKSRKRHVPLDESVDQAATASTEEIVVGNVRAAVDNLPTNAKEVVLLHYFSGLTHEQIARALGISTQAVHGRLQRARRFLAAVLTAEIKSEQTR